MKQKETESGEGYTMWEDFDADDATSSVERRTNDRKTEKQMESKMKFTKLRERQTEKE